MMRFALSSAARSLALPLLGLLSAAVPALAQNSGLDDSLFFRQGRDQFQTEIERLQERAPSPVFTVNDGSQQWQPIVSEAGGFSVGAPLGTLLEESKTANIAGNSLVFQLLMSQTTMGRYLVAYADIPAGQTADQIILDLVPVVVEQIEAPLTQDQSFSTETYAGRELRFQSSETTTLMRVLTGDQRVYVVGASQTQGGEPTDTTLAFLNSFQLLMN